jgi:hypothetical protein
MAMGVDFELAVDEEPVGGIAAAYTDAAEIEFLREVFPGRHWNIPDWKEFDFVGNEDRVRRRIEEFRELARSKEQGKSIADLFPPRGETIEEQREFAI